MRKQDIKKGQTATLTINTYKKEGKKKIASGSDKVRVEIQGMVPKSRTKCKVKVIERGPGYDEKSGKYHGVRTRTSWSRGERKDHGVVIECHIKDLD